MIRGQDKKFGIEQGLILKFSIVIYPFHNNYTELKRSLKNGKRQEKIF